MFALENHLSNANNDFDLSVLTDMNGDVKALPPIPGIFVYNFINQLQVKNLI